MPLLLSHHGWVDSGLNFGAPFAHAYFQGTDTKYMRLKIKRKYIKLKIIKLPLFLSHGYTDQGGSFGAPFARAFLEGTHTK